MDTAIIAAIVSGVFALASAFIGSMKIKKKNKELNAKNIQISSIEDAIIDQHSGTKSYYAYSIAKFEKNLRFNEKGTGYAIQQYHGVRVNHNIDGLSIPYNSSSLLKTVEYTSLELNTGANSGAVVELQKINSNEENQLNVIRCNFNCLGYLTPQTAPINFSFHYYFKGLFEMDRQKSLERKNILKGWTGEVSGLTVAAPINEIEMTINFPESYVSMSPEPFPVVFIKGNLGIIHNSETNRIKSDFNFSMGIARLKVNNPSVGLSYCISWVPFNR